MLYQEIPIQVPGCDETALLISYIPSNSPEIEQGRRRPAVIICPGGGYHFLSDREAEPIAIRLNALGLNAFILRYSVAPALYPIPQKQLAMAVHTVRSRSELFLTDPDSIFVAGFSAGGHLAASLGILWQDKACYSGLGLSPEQIRPTGMILSYPVITSGEYAHRNSFLCLLGEKHDLLYEELSLEKRVGKDAVPAFIWHTCEDDLVPVENSLLLAAALRRHHVSMELHIYPSGRHGLSLSSDQVYGPDAVSAIRPECQAWIDMAARWVFSLSKEISLQA